MQNPVHKDTTRVEIIGWLDEVNSRLTTTREGARERVTAVAENLSAELEKLSKVCQVAEARLAEAVRLIVELRQENALLLSRLNIS